MDKIINEKNGEFTVKGYGASGKLVGGKTLKEMDVTRNLPNTEEVMIEVLYCGVCHSDIHQVNNDWDNTRYPCVPGHEVIGRIVKTGDNVKKFKVGQVVGVGCMIDSCQTCQPCENDQEQFCQGPHGPTMTYNGYFRDSASDFNTYGGYSTHITCNEKFLIKIPKDMDISAAAPILCAGITTYSPLKQYGVTKGTNVGIVGIGGLGHMAVQLAKALGAKVTAITTSPEKKNDAKKLGADDVLISSDADAMNKMAMRFDFILVTIPYAFDVNPYIELLSINGKLVTVGLLGDYEKPINNMNVAMWGRSIAGSVIGGIAETQEVIDFCAKNNILPEVKLISIEDINDAFKDVKNENIRFRHVIDMSK